MATLTIPNDFVAGAAIIATDMNANFTALETFVNSTPGVLQLTGGIVTGAVTLSNTLAVGADDTGYDVKFFGATTGKSWLWDESGDTMFVTGGTLLYGDLTVGVDDIGHDVKFFGATATNGYMLWDQSTDDLILGSVSRLGIGTTTPSGPLDIESASGPYVYLNDSGGTVGADSNARVIFQAGGSQAGVIGFTGTTAGIMTIDVEDGKLYIQTTSADDIYLRTAETTRMTVTAAGNVGIGATSTSSRLKVQTPSDWNLGDPAVEIVALDTDNGSGSGLRIVAGYGTLDYPLLVREGDGTNVMYARGDGLVYCYQDFTVAGTKSFTIKHPVKGGDWMLRHAAVEAPRADLIYRGTVTLTGGTATVDLDAVSNMTDGTWEALCRDPWAMVASSGNAVEWSLAGKTLTITSDTADAVCSWMVMAERQDAEIKSAKNTDADGHVIPEFEDASLAAGGPPPQPEPEAEEAEEAA